MNRYPLNSRVIGAGSESPLSYATAIQNFVLNVAAAAVAIRGMRANQSLTLAQTSRALAIRLMTAAQTLVLDATVITKLYFMAYAEAAQSFILQTTATARQRIKRYAQAAQVLALTASMTLHQWIKTFAATTQNFALGQSSKFMRYAYAKANQPMALTSRIVSTLIQSAKSGAVLALNGIAVCRTAIRATANQLMQLVTSAVAANRTSSPANSERTVEVPSASQTVVVPGESYESGV